jgi:hypothetical protein
MRSFFKGGKSLLRGSSGFQSGDSTTTMDGVLYVARPRGHLYTARKKYPELGMMKGIKNMTYKCI